MNEAYQDLLSIGHQVLDTLERASHYTDEAEDGMLHRRLVDVQEVKQELIAHTALQKEYVVAHQLVYQVLSQFRRYLKSIYSEGEEDLDHTFYIALLFCLNQLVLVLCHYSLAEQFGSVCSALGREDLVVLVQLDLVVFYCFGQGCGIGDNVTVLDVVQLL